MRREQKVQRINSLLLLSLCALGLLTSGTNAETAIPREFHEWGRFAPGSWKRVRVQAEVFDEDGRVESTSITETTTTVQKVTDEHVVLKVDVTLEVAGKLFKREPKIVQKNYSSKEAGQTVKETKLAATELRIGGEVVEADKRKVIINTPEANCTRIETFSAKYSPYFIERRVDCEGPNEEFLYSTHARTIALNMPHRVLSDVKSCSHVETIHKKGPESEVVTVEVHAGDVPGGVVAHSQKELHDGRLIRRSTLEILDYEIKPQENVTGRRTGPVRRLINKRRNR